MKDKNNTTDLVAEAKIAKAVAKESPSGKFARSTSSGQIRAASFTAHSRPCLNALGLKRRGKSYAAWLTCGRLSSSLELARLGLMALQELGGKWKRMAHSRLRALSSSRG